MFDFGKNWENYSLSALNQDSLDKAKISISSLLDDDIANKTFLDIGSGTGLFSLGASQLGFNSVLGLDVNPKCIQVAKNNANRFLDNPEKVDFKEISVLNTVEMEKIDEYNYVYAWGSLHHTGNMTLAIENASKRVKQGGKLVLAIYNRHWTSPVWWLIKAFYNVLPGFLKILMVYLFVPVIFLAKFIVTFKNPLKMERGMNFFYDVVDWVGGYPYEYESIEETNLRLKKLGFKNTKNIAANVPTGCNEFVFVKNENLNS